MAKIGILFRGDTLFSAVIPLYVKSSVAGTYTISRISVDDTFAWYAGSGANGSQFVYNQNISVTLQADVEKKIVIFYSNNAATGAYLNLSIPNALSIYGLSDFDLSTLVGHDLLDIDFADAAVKVPGVTGLAFCRSALACGRVSYNGNPVGVYGSLVPTNPIPSPSAIFSASAINWWMDSGGSIRPAGSVEWPTMFFYEVQTITPFATIAAKTPGAAPFTIILPTSSSGLPVTVNVQSGPATISGNTITLTGASGTVVLAANQAGDANLAAATQVTTSFSVGKLTQTIAPFATIVNPPYTPVMTITPPVASSGLPVTVAVQSGPALIDGNTITLIGEGTVVLTASQDGNATYLPSAQVTTSFLSIAMVPVISSSSSVIEFPINDTWIFQPRATKSPTSWAWTNLPPGIYANSATGAIGGSVNVQGIWIATVTATNSSGSSAAYELPISIYAGAWNNPASIEVKIDATNGQILTPPSFSFKTDTDILLDIAFFDGASTPNLLVLNLGTLRLVMKDPSTGETIFESTGEWTPLGDVTVRHYEINLGLRGERLNSVFEGPEDSIASFSALAEIRFDHAVRIAGLPVILKKITPSFPITLTRNLLGT